MSEGIAIMSFKITGMSSSLYGDRADRVKPWYNKAHEGSNFSCCIEYFVAAEVTDRGHTLHWFVPGEDIWHVTWDPSFHRLFAEKRSPLKTFPAMSWCPLNCGCHQLLALKSSPQPKMHAKSFALCCKTAPNTRIPLALVLAHHGKPFPPHCMAIPSLFYALQMLLDQLHSERSPCFFSAIENVLGDTA